MGWQPRGFFGDFSGQSLDLYGVRSSFRLRCAVGDEILCGFSLWRDRVRWFQVIAGLFGMINGGTLQRLKYFLTENRILRRQIPGGVKLGEALLRMLAELADR